MIYSLIICLFLMVPYLLLAADAQEPNQEKAAKKCPDLTGKLVFPNDKNYDKARLNSNYHTSKSKFPKIIVYCQNVQDVQNAVKWARCHEIPIRVRSGGHSHESFSTGSAVMLIDVSEMKKLQVNKSQGIATVEPGITGGELYNRLFKEGFTQVGGTCEGVGVSGLILTGGIGPLLRKHGLACDNLVAFDMVDANGQLIHVTQDNEYKDLFWAACGAGAGNFGVVTSLVIKIYPAAQVTWFNIGWDWSQPIEDVIATWQNLFLNGDKKWFSHLDIWSKSFPSKEFQKQPVKALGVFYGTPEEAKRSLAPLLSIGKPSDQTIELVNWNKAIKLFEDSTSTFITETPEYKSPGTFVIKPLPQEAIKIIVSTLQHSPSPLLNVLLFSLGGALQDQSPSATPFFYRDAKFYIIYTIQWMNEKDEAKSIKELNTLRQRLLPYTIGSHFSNPDLSPQDYLISYYGTNVKRLKCIKRKYDPQNIFQFEQSIPPAKEDCDSAVQ